MTDRRFLDRLSLEVLIAPTAKEEFIDQYWEQQPLVIGRAQPDYYGDLLTIDDFDSAVARSPSYVKMANAIAKKNKSYSSSVEGLEAILADMQSGSTLVLDQVHHTIPHVRELCQVLGAEFGHRFQTNLYLTPPGGKGFSPHWDNHDVFILQVHGSKDWQIEKTRRVFPDRTDRMGDDGREFQGEVLSFRLNKGDLAYIPRGFVHAAACCDEPSLHITLGVTGYFFHDLVHAAVATALPNQAEWRRALPIGFLSEDPNRLASHLRNTLLEMADFDNCRKVIDEFLNAVVKAHPLDVRGQVREFFLPEPVSLSLRVQRRRNLVYRIHEQPEAVQLNYGARSITFPAFFRPALDYALHASHFSVGELPGEIENVERLALVERLLQEGVLIKAAID